MKSLIATLPPELAQFMDGLSLEILKKSGASQRLNRSAILRAVSRAFRSGKFDVRNITSEDEFVRAILEQIRQRRDSSSRG